jgi:hypothetical protein
MNLVQPSLQFHKEASLSYAYLVITNPLLSKEGEHNIVFSRLMSSYSLIKARKSQIYCSISIKKDTFASTFVQNNV